MLFLRTYPELPASLISEIMPSTSFSNPTYAIFQIAHQTSVTLVFWIVICSSALLYLKYAASLDLNISTATTHTHHKHTHKHVHSWFLKLTFHLLGLSLNVALSISKALPEQSSHFLLYIDTHNLRALASLFLHNFLRIIGLIFYLFVFPHEGGNYTCSIHCYNPLLSSVTRL